MARTILQKCRTLVRYFWPSVADKAYIRQIKIKNKFDREFYLTTNPGLRWAFRIWPERHFVQLGESHGLCPNAQFSPRAYMFHNPEIVVPGFQPLKHFIETGEAEGRIVLAPLGQKTPAASDLPSIKAEDRPEHPARVAVLLHVYYGEFWDEIVPTLSAQTFPLDLYVTITQRDGAEQIAQKIQSEWPNSQVWLMPNHGRDIFPFLHLINSNLFETYEAVCKLHSKRSPHRPDGDVWRKALVRGLLDDPEATSTRLKTFLQDDKSGIWAANEQRCEGDSWWGANRPKTTELLARIGLDAPQDSLCFPAGSIYWIKASVIERLRGLELNAADFDPEQALVDGTTAHAVERILGFLVQAEGKHIIETDELDLLSRNG